jgi:hypothetical protein
MVSGYRFSLHHSCAKTNKISGDFLASNTSFFLKQAAIFMCQEVFVCMSCHEKIFVFDLHVKDMAEAVIKLLCQNNH